MESLAGVPHHPCGVDHLDTFHGLPVLTFPRFTDLRPLPDDASRVAWRLWCDPSAQDGLYAYMDRFVASVPLEEVRALVIGAPWYGNEGDADEVIAELVAPAERSSC